MWAAEDIRGWLGTTEIKVKHGSVPWVTLCGPSPYSLDPREHTFSAEVLLVRRRMWVRHRSVVIVPIRDAAHSDSNRIYQTQEEGTSKPLVVGGTSSQVQGAFLGLPGAR